MVRIMTSDELFARAVEEARLVMYWRRQAEALRSGGTIAGCDRRRALALARRCEGAVFNLAIKAERTAGTAGTEAATKA